MDPIIFTEDQQNAYDSIINFIEKGTNTYALLEGAAGTGKSTLTAHIIRHVLDKATLFGKIAVAAPTHKAVRVVKRMFSEQEQQSIDFTSMHSLLGLRHQITSNGKEIFKRDPRSTCKLGFYDLIIVDEASMIADELFIELNEQNYRDVKVLFVGDGNQINPINHVHSIPMMPEKRAEFNILHYRLTKVVRQAETNPIIQVSQKVLRDEFTYTPGHKEMVDKTGVVVLNSDNSILKKLLHLYFCDEKFDNNPDYCKVLSWTNATVDIFNKTIRKMKYGNVGKIVKGEKLIVDRPIKFPDNDIEVLFTTNEDLKVLDVEVSQREIDGNYYKYYMCTVEGDVHIEQIQVIHEDSERQFNMELAKLSESATKEGDIKSRIKKWKVYYNFMEEFAAVKYNYALTVHNCVNKDMKVFVKDKGLIPVENVETGDMIKNSFGFNPVINKVYTGQKAEYRVTTRSGYELLCSNEHRIKIVDENENVEFRPLKDIKIGDYICVDRSYDNIKDQLNFPKKYSDELIWYIGLLVGDGNYSGNAKKSYNRVELSIFGGDTDVVRKLRPLEDQYKNFNLKFNVYSGGVNKRTKKERNMIRCIVDNKQFRDFLEDEVGLLRHQTHEYKTTPKIVFNLPLDQQALYIRGLFDSDGNSSKNRLCYRFVNKNKNIIYDLQQLLLLQGIASIISISKLGYYCLSIMGPSAFIYKDKIGFGCQRKDNIGKDFTFLKGKTNFDNIPYKQTILKHLRSDFKHLCSYTDPRLCAIFRNHKNLSYDQFQLCLGKYVNHNSIYKNEINVPEVIQQIRDFNYYYDPIVSIEKTGKYADMYDLEVDTNHEFTCNGVVVHNSQGSTYSNAFLVYHDIMKNSRKDEKKRIMYTAVTRPKEMLFVI